MSRFNSHNAVALIALAVAILATAGAIVSSSVSVNVARNLQQIPLPPESKERMWSERVLHPLVAEFGGQPQANPFTLKPVGPPPSRLPPPPPPRLDMPTPPILPLPEN